MQVNVNNLTSPRTGNPVANQFEIRVGDAIYFQSYRTMIAKKEGGVITLDSNALDYSRTTSKYLYQFLGMDRKEILKDIKCGIIKEEDLNESIWR